MGNIALLALAIGPGLAFAAYIYMKDKYEKEPLGLVVRAFFLGMLSTIPAVLLETLGMSLGFQISSSMLMTAIFAFVVVGFSEEISKFLFLRFGAYNKPAFNEPFDGIVYGAMVSLGFATLENVLYVFGAGNFGESVSVGIARMFTAVPAHLCFGIMMGYSVGQAKFSPDGARLMKRGVLTATILHGAYDFFLMQSNFPGLAFVAFIVLLMAGRMSKQAIDELSEESPFKK